MSKNPERQFVEFVSAASDEFVYLVYVFEDMDENEEPYLVETARVVAWAIHKYDNDAENLLALPVLLENATNATMLFPVPSPGIRVGPGSKVMERETETYDNIEKAAMTIYQRAKSRREAKVEP